MRGSYNDGVKLFIWEPCLFSNYKGTAMSSIHSGQRAKRTDSRMIFWLVTGILLFAPYTTIAANTDRQTLINLTQNYFNAVAARDTGSLRDYLLPDAQFIYRNDESPDSKIGVTSVPDLLVKLPVMQSHLLERMRDPVVLVQGNIGIVWTRYDFFQDKQFSHCGTDAFTFLKTKGGWRIAGASWSVEKSTCKPAPLNLPLK